MNSTKQICLFIILFTVFGLSVEGQVRRKPTKKIEPKKEAKKEKGKPTYLIGATTAYSGITGLAVEVVGKSNKSTYSLEAGYSSRRVRFDSPFIVLDTTLTNKTEMVHGLGANVCMNNYFSKYKQGLAWTVGIGGHYFFKKSNAKIYNITDEPYYRSGPDLKFFSVFGRVSFRLETDSDMYLTPFIGGGIMATPFKSTFHSKINGAFFQGGINFVMKL